MKLPPFEYSCPEKLADAVALLAAHGGEAKALAGGQSLVPMLAFRVASPSLIVDLRKLDELRRIDISEDGITLGATVRWRIRCLPPQSLTLPIIRSATAALSAAASRTRTRPPKCRALP